MAPSRQFTIDRMPSEEVVYTSMKRPDGELRSLLVRHVGAKVANHRQKHEPPYSQTELAKKIGSTRAFVSALECGSQGVSLEKLCRIADALEINPGQLLPTRNEVNAWLDAARDKESQKPDEEILREFVEELVKGGRYGRTKS